MKNITLKILSALCLLWASAAWAQEREEYVVASLTNNLAVTVDWMEQYAYGTAAGAGGSVGGTANGWYDEGTAISNAATADEHYEFSGWTGAPAGQELENPLVFALDGSYTNVTATFALKNYQVQIVSTHPWFGAATIGNPAGAGSYPALSAVTASVDRIVVDPGNPGRRLRFTGAREE
jgi:hypothetical protein